MQTNNIKIGIIGCGNMGAAVACGLANGTKIKPENIFVGDINIENLTKIKNFDNRINVTESNLEVVQNADIIIIAVKPWIVESVVNQIQQFIDPQKHIVISLAAMVEISELLGFLQSAPAIYRIVPNTAIEFGQSMTAIASANTSVEQDELVMSIFAELGKVIQVSEKQIPAFMSLTSCGIAFALRYIRAAMTGGVQMGISAKMAEQAVLQTLRGAITLLETNDLHPEEEIDRVTTPGGITIIGLNEMEANGFSNAVIKGLIASKPTK
ncbi:MAG: pyrroline-5-carboxylate reductase [Paludibacter sp.]|jgi:pyrroline-5-carboxylate reductase|nr:pyrroline-5-carboxylate reductase [Paludibacter sp.]